jgi:hypothetical protein
MKFVVVNMGRLVKKFQIPVTYNPSKRSVDERASIEQKRLRCDRAGVRESGPVGHVETVRQVLKGETWRDSEYGENTTESPDGVSAPKRRDRL